MINLLPPKIKKEQKVKLISGQINTAIVVLSIMVALTYTAVHFVNYFLKVVLDRNTQTLTETNIEKVGLKPIREQVDQINTKINKIDQLKSERIEWSIFIQNFNTVIPTKVSISSMSVDKKAGSFNISASAETREDIVKLQARLESLDNLKNLSFQNSTFDSTNNCYNFNMTGILE